MMIILISLLLVSSIFDVKSSILIPRQRRAPLARTKVVLATPTVDPITEQADIDDQWERCMITAPATINLLGQAMVVASKADVSFKLYSPDRTFKYIRNPRSMRATLLQISHDGYRAFLGAHTSMNKIQLYMQQIPRHVKTAIKILTSDASQRYIARQLPLTLKNVERIGQSCVTISRGTENAFVAVMDLLMETLEAVEETHGLHESDLKNKEIQLNVTRILHADMKQEEEFRQQRYKEIRKAVRKAQDQYSKALSEIPTGWKAVALELGRAVVSIVKGIGNMMPRSGDGGSRSGGRGSGSGIGSDVVNFATSQIFNLVSRFSQTLDSLTGCMTSDTNNATKGNELKSYKITLEAFARMINDAPNNPAKDKAIGLAKRGVELATEAEEDKEEKNEAIKQELNELSNEVKPFIAAQQLSSTNKAPISASNEGDSMQNELFKAQLAQVRLSEVEKRLDEHYAGRLEAIAQMRALTEKMANLDLTVIHYKEIVEMLKEVFRLLGELRRQWHELVLFFSNLAAQIEVALNGSLMPFIEKARGGLDAEATKVDRQLTLELLQDDTNGIYHHSHVLFVMSRTYYDVSKKYLMGRLADLSRMLTMKNDQERTQLLGELERDTRQVQDEIGALVLVRKNALKRKISEERAKLNQQIDSLGADGNELEVIEEGQALLDLKGTD